jgi:hypothetical protein
MTDAIRKIQSAADMQQTNGITAVQIVFDDASSYEQSFTIGINLLANQSLMTQLSQSVSHKFHMYRDKNHSSTISNISFLLPAIKANKYNGIKKFSSAHFNHFKKLIIIT